MASTNKKILGLVLLSIIDKFSNADVKPNIVFILTDDQDLDLGGEVPMVKTKSLIGEAGMTFKHMYTTTPLCCPSRSSIFTGRYMHNHGTVNNSVEGNCSSPSWQQTQELDAFPTVLSALGYTTFFAGKYLNQYGSKEAGGVEHVPPGWNYWNGLVGNSVYYNYSLSVNGKLESHGDNYSQDYLTDVIHQRAIQFLKQQQKSSSPFFMMLSTPACHAPFTAAPQYNKKFPNVTAPRDGSYNVKPQNKHWLLRQTIVPMPDDTVQTADDFFRKRWQTLLSVDDMVEDVINTLNKLGYLQNTYVFFSSDNGFHLGQFGLPYDKRQMYNFDIRVPLMVRGPGIQPGQTSHDVVMNIDFAPTFLDLVDQTMLPNVDGISLRPILHQNNTKLLRQFVLVEHQGEHLDTVNGCPQYKHQDMGFCDKHCVCEDSKNNSYACVLHFMDQSTLKYCEFEDSENFIEVYETNSDPYELKNLYPIINPKLIAELDKQLRYLALCVGPTCNSMPR